MIKYEVWWDRITPVEVIGETKRMVVMPSGRRRAKWAEHRNYFDTWQEAHAFLVAEAADKLQSARLALQRAQGHFGNIKGMKPPVESESGQGVGV